MNRTATGRFASIGVVFLLALQHVAHAAEIVCPPNINVEEKLTADAPLDQWAGTRFAAHAE